MSKFFKLCSCEFTKTMKKRSTKIMIIILVVSLFLSAGLAELTKKMFSFTEEYTASADYKTSLRSDIETLKADLETNGGIWDENTKNNTKAQIDVDQYALDYDINVNKTYWKSTMLQSDILNSKYLYYNYMSLQDEASAEKEQANIDKKIELIKNDDFSGYINAQRDILKENKNLGVITEEEYNDSLYILDLREKYEIGKEYNSEDTWKEVIVEEIGVLKQNLNYGIDTLTQKSLDEKDLKKTEETIKINEYRLEHNIPPYMTATSVGNTRKVYDYMVGGLTMLVLAVMMIIIAGSAISTEISKGTIKFWSFTPNKRWKILLSKLVVSVFILLLMTVFITILSTLIGNLFFGSKNAQGYLYVSGGTVHNINYIVYFLLYNLVGAIDIFMFLLLALMLSTVTRNTAVAVGVSIATYLGGSTIMQLINLFVKTSDWTKFIPFNNLSLADRIFTNDVSYSASTMVNSVIGNTTVSFSLCVLGVSAILMIVTMFDSFRKRDIL